MRFTERGLQRRATTIDWLDSRVGPLSMRTCIAFLILSATSPAWAIDCSTPLPAAPAAIASGPVAPAAGLEGAAAADSARPVFGVHGADLSVDAVIARLRAQQCVPVASAADSYTKRTEFDNTPYRFNMKPGQKLSAAEFDAWMESRGIRIVKAKAEAAPVDPTAATPAVAAPAVAPAVAR